MPAPESIGRYRIVRPLGSGAMGDVYLAEDPKIGRRVAIKTVRVVGGSEEDVEERSNRLLREARAAGKLMHPNVVALFDADDLDDGTLYLAFEYIEGLDLSKRAAAAPALTLRQVLRLAREVASALGFAHGHGIVHRDIKPSNLLIGPDGTAKVADFGIAKLRDGSTELTRTGSVVGSPQYMSPEQVRGEELDGRSDLFSLGVVLYELSSRHRPFGGDTLSTLIFEILAKEPPSVDELRPGLPTKWVGLVHRLLAKDRDARPATAEEVVAELDALLAQLPGDALDAPVVPGEPGPTRPLPRSAGSVADAVAPTSTLQSAPTRPSAAVPPPPPPPPGSVGPAASGPPAAGPPPPPSPGGPADAIAETMIVESGVAEKGVADRPSPLDTGTYGGPAFGRGARWGLLAALALVVVLAGAALAWHFTRSDPEPEPSAADPTTLAQTPPPDMPDPEPEPDPELPATEPSLESADEVPTDPPSPAPATVSPPPPATEPPPEPRPRVAEVEIDQAPQPRPRGPVAERVAERIADRREERREERRDQPATTPTVPPQRPAPPPPEITEADRRRAEFDAAAARAHREIETGLSFRFDIEPDDAIVKFQRRGDRSRVQGRAAEFAPDDDDAKSMDLPGAGDYLVTLVREPYPEVVMLVHAESGRGGHVVRLDMSRAAKRIERSSDGEAIDFRTRSVLTFQSWPGDAEIWVDGEKKGTAADFRGHRIPRHSSNLRLDDGRHALRVLAPGRSPVEFVVEVGGGADEWQVEIPYRRE